MKLLGQSERRDEQRAVIVGLRMGGEVIEDAVNGGGDFRIGGEQTEVSIETSGIGVVVAGAEVGIAANGAIGVAADEQGQLAVRLEADDAVKDLDACVFKVARPADVGGFVEAGDEFDDGSDLLGLGGFGESLKDGRVGAGAVEGLLHRDDVGILAPRLR